MITVGLRTILAVSCNPCGVLIQQADLCIYNRRRTEAAYIDRRCRQCIAASKARRAS